MLAVIFELEPVAERKQEYLDYAAQLASELTHIDGFISIERFESLAQPGKLLSLSFWRDEAAISAWRNLEKHRVVVTVHIYFPDFLHMAGGSSLVPQFLAGAAPVVGLSRLKGLFP